MFRVSVVGNSGSGKTTFGRALAERLGVVALELDGVFHQPGWTELPDAEFRRRVAELTAADGGWVVDGNYSKVRDIVWGSADTVVWLDLPRRVVMRRVIGRTFRRAARRQELWNGNRERWANFVSINPENSIIAWAWSQHANYRTRYEEAMADPRWSHLRFERLRSAAEVNAFLTQSGDGPSGRRGRRQC